MPYYNNSGHGSSPYQKDGSSGPSNSSGGRSGSSEPTYMMEHLATFTVTKETGIVCPADGMRRLLQLEKSNGIWSQKMQLRLEHNWVLIIDNETGAVMERFPADQIQEPTAFSSRNSMEMYNNILIFTVGDNRSSQKSEMHIFHCQSVSAQDLVEDLQMLQIGKLVTGGSPRGKRGQIPPPPTLPPPEPPLNGVNVREQVSAFNANHNNNNHTHNNNNTNEREDNNDEVSSTSSEKYERDVTVLNHCFDDIEKFIARLQHAAAASRELERRRRNRKTKKNSSGDGILAMRAKPPPEIQFIDIFQKFKLSFNLLAKLKAHIHDPNAPELVHFLFTPLALIVDASHDTNYDQNLPSKVVSPLLTREAVNLLINCVTSKETELWQSLGDTWTMARDQWKGHVPPYHPIFEDGFSPDYPIPEERDHDHLASLLNADKQKRDDIPEQQTDNYYGHRDAEESHYSSDYLEYESREERGNDYFDRDRNYGTGTDVYSREDRDRTEQTRAHSDISVDSIERNGQRGGIERGEGRGGINNTGAIDRAQEAWFDDLINRHAKIVQVTYPRTANNDKELTVVRGEYLEILDDSRKWWKARNSRGQIAHVPHTIVAPHNATHPNNDNDTFNNPLYTTRYQRQSHGYNYEDSEIEGTSTSPGPEATHRTHAIPPPAPADWVRKERLGKKDEKSENKLEMSKINANLSGFTKSFDTDASTSTNSVKTSWQLADKLETINISDVDKRLSKKEDKIINKEKRKSLSLMIKNTLKTNNNSKTIVSSPPPPPPPPPPPFVPPSPTISSSSENSSQCGTLRSIKSLNDDGSNHHQMHQELKSVLNQFRDKKRVIEVVKTPECFVDQQSTSEEVQAWLSVKGFSEKICKQFNGISGSDLFSLTKEELEQHCGPIDGKRLHGQITLSRNASGFQSTRTFELKSILQKARSKADTTSADN